MMFPMLCIMGTTSQHHESMLPQPPSHPPLPSLHASEEINTDECQASAFLSLTPKSWSLPPAKHTWMLLNPLSCSQASLYFYCFTAAEALPLNLYTLAKTLAAFKIWFISSFPRATKCPWRGSQPFRLLSHFHFVLLQFSYLAPVAALFFSIADSHLQRLYKQGSAHSWNLASFLKAPQIAVYPFYLTKGCSELPLPIPNSKQWLQGWRKITPWRTDKQLKEALIYIQQLQGGWRTGLPALQSTAWGLSLGCGWARLQNMGSPVQQQAKGKVERIIMW